MSSESNYSLTVKVNGDLFTIRGDSAEQFSENLRNVITNNVLSFIGAVQETIAQDGATPSNAVKVIEQAFAPVQTTSFPPVDKPFPAAPAPAYKSTPDVPTCIHGPRKWNEGVSKAGNPYRGWFCQEKDRASQCKPQYQAAN